MDPSSSHDGMFANDSLDLKIIKVHFSSYECEVSQVELNIKEFYFHLIGVGGSVKHDIHIGHDCLIETLVGWGAGSDNSILILRVFNEISEKLCDLFGLQRDCLGRRF